MPLSTSEILLNLIPTLQVEVLVRWLTIKDVARLDSALCSVEQRGQFLTILDEKHCIFEHTSCDICSGYFSWVIKRHIKISTAELPRDFDSVRQNQLFQTTGKYLHKLRVPSFTQFERVENFKNILPELSTMCRNLRELVFTGSDLSKTDICSILQYFSRLQHLDLAHCKHMTGEMIININTNVTILQSLILTGCSITSSIPPNTLVANHTIHTLTLFNVKGLQNLIPFVTQCKDLRVFCVDEIPLNDILTIMTECPKIRSLSVGVMTSQNIQISDAEFNTLISHLHALDHLQLYLSQYQGLQDDQIERLICHCPNLRVLIGCPRTWRFMGEAYSFITTKTFNSVCDTPQSRLGKPLQSTQHQLQSLVVSTITVAALRRLLACCPLLTNVNIASPASHDGQSVLGEFMTALSTSNVKSIEIGSCRHAQRSDFLPLRNLTALSLTESNLKHSDVVGIIARNPQLRKLCLINCPALTQETLLYIVRRCKYLEDLRFDNILAGLVFEDNVDTSLIVKFALLARPNLKTVSIQLCPY